MTRPFSVNMFKPPTLASGPSPGNNKFGVPPQNGGHVMGWFPSWSLFTQAKIPASRAANYPYISAAPSGENHLIPRNFSIYPCSNANGTYIYQSSISNKSEAFSTSEFDSSSSASYTPSSFSPALSSSTDSLTTASSSSPTDAASSLPFPNNHPIVSEDPRTPHSAQMPSSASQAVRRDEDASAHRPNDRPGPLQRQISHAPHSTPPMPDDHRTFLNTEYNSRTVHYRGASANMSHSGSDFAPSVASNPSDIMLHPPLTSPERRHATAQAAAPISLPSVSRVSPTPANFLPEVPNRLQLVPLPPVSEDSFRGDSRPEYAQSSHNPSTRRDSSFMPYYFPDPLSTGTHPTQYNSQTAGGGTLPLPPGLAFSDVSHQRSYDSTLWSEMRASSPSNSSATSGLDLGGIQILTYDEEDEGSTLPGDSDVNVGLVNASPRSEHATRTSPSMPMSLSEQRRRSYASVAASRLGSSSSSSTLVDERQSILAPSIAQSHQVIPPLPTPSTSSAPSPSSTPHPKAPQPYSVSHHVPPIPVSQSLLEHPLPMRASPESADPLPRQSPVNVQSFSYGDCRSPIQSSPLGRADRGLARSPERGLRETVPETRRMVTIPVPSGQQTQRERSISPPHVSAQAAPPSATHTVAGRIRRDSLASAHMRLDHHEVPNVLAAPTPSTPANDIPALSPSSASRPESSATRMEALRRAPPQRRHSADDAPRAEVKQPAPYRRHSDGDRNPPQLTSIPERSSVIFNNPAMRTVRWNENLICPSPIFPDQRRQGWFNKRGFVAIHSTSSPH